VPENNKNLKFKKMEDFYPSLGSIVQAQLGDSLHALKVLETLIRKFDNKENFDEFESQYLLDCLKKMTVKGSDVNCNDPYINDPFNLKEKEKQQNTTGLSGNKKKNQEICYKEVMFLISHHKKIKDAASCKAKGLDGLDGLEALGLLKTLGFLDGKSKYSDVIFLDYSKKWSKNYIYKIIVQILKEKYSIHLNENTVRLYLSDNKDLLKDY